MNLFQEGKIRIICVKGPTLIFIYFLKGMKKTNVDKKGKR